jgi:hypothetical protein
LELELELDNEIVGGHWKGNVFGGVCSVEAMCYFALGGQKNKRENGKNRAEKDRKEYM